MVTFLKYKKNTIGHAIYSEEFSYSTVSYLTDYNYDVMSTTNNEIAFPRLIKVFQEAYEIKIQ